MRQIFTLISCLAIFFISSAQTPKATEKTAIVFQCRAIPSSFSNEPLLVIDGVLKDKFDLKEIDPDNIESINILNEVNSALIFCNSSPRGVIIITTKNANQRVIKVKDNFSGEPLPVATVELIYKENGKDTSWYQKTDSLGNFKTKKIINNKLYKLKVSCIGYKTYVADVNAGIIGKNYTVLLEKDYSKLSEVVVTAYGSRTIRCGGVMRVIRDSSFERASAKQNSFRIYPNPVARNQKTHIEFLNENEKKLTLRLFDLGGKLINSIECSVAKGINRVNYLLDSKIASGLYIIQIFDTNNKVIKSEKLVIQ